MTADIVVGGLGGDGPIVTAGLGLTAAPDPNAMRATITASGALHATLSAAGTQGGGGVVWSVPWNRPASVAVQPAYMSAALSGTSKLTATLTGVDRDLQMALLLLDLELTITEGVTL